MIVAVQVHNFDATLEDAARDCGATTWEVYRYVTIPAALARHILRGDLRLPAELGKFLPDLQPRRLARTLPTFIFSGIATGSSPLYPAIATVVFIPGILLVILASRLRRA